MTTEKTLQPIVNGSFNFEMTNEQVFALDFETKKHCTWILIVSLQFAHSFKNIAYEVFTPVVCKYTHDMITDETVNDIFTTVRAQFEKRQLQLDVLTSNLYYQQGQQIYKAQQELGFKGFLEMDYRKLAGYLQAIGSWNDFEHFKVIDAIKKIENEVPRFYMVNNPNNGQPKHKWTVTGEYITMKFEYVSKEDKDIYLNFYENTFNPTAKSVRADSVRYELEELPYEHYSLELIMWWD